MKHLVWFILAMAFVTVEKSARADGSAYKNCNPVLNDMGSSPAYALGPNGKLNYDQNDDNVSSFINDTQTLTYKEFWPAAAGKVKYETKVHLERKGDLPQWLEVTYDPKSRDYNGNLTSSKITFGYTNQQCFVKETSHKVHSWSGDTDVVTYDRDFCTKLLQAQQLSADTLGKCQSSFEAMEKLINQFKDSLGSRKFGIDHQAATNDKLSGKASNISALEAAGNCLASRQAFGEQAMPEAAPASSSGSTDAVSVPALAQPGQ